MIRRIVLHIIICFLSLTSLAQNFEDSIYILYKRVQPGIDTFQITPFNAVKESILNYAERAAESEDFCSQAYAHGRIGALYYYRADFFLCFHHFKKELEILENNCSFDSIKIDRTYRNIASILNTKIEDQKAAIFYYGKAIELCTESNSCNRSFRYLINLFQSLGAFNECITHLNQYKSQFRSESDIAFYHEYMGNVLSARKQEGDLREAVKHLEKSAQIYYAIKYGSFLINEKLRALNYMEMGDLESALEINSKLLTDPVTPKIERAGILSNHSLILRRAGKLNEALRVLYDALAIYKQSDAIDEEERKGGLSMVYDNLAEVFLVAREIDSALVYGNRCVSVLFPGQEASNAFFNPTAEQIQLFDAKDDLINRLFTKYRGQSLYFEKTGKAEYMEAGLETIIALDQTIDAYRWEYKDRGTLLAWRNKLKDRYRHIIDFCAGINEVDLAFHFMEKSKSVLLSDALPGLPDIPDEERYQIRLLQKLLAQSEREDMDQIIVDSLENELTTLKAKLGPERADYFINKYQNQHITLTEAQEFLNNDQVAIEYHFLNETSLLALIIESQGSTMRTLDLSPNFKQQLIRFVDINGDSQSGDITEWIDLSLSIYQQILAPLALKHKRYVIIPDGLLGLIPFAALLFEEPEDRKFSKLPYLIKKVEISNQYTLAIAKRIRELGPSHLSEAVVFVPTFSEITPININNASDKVIQYYPLEYNISEGREIAELLTATLHEGESATKFNFLQWLDSAAILHIPTHAIALPEHPDHSHIVFQEADGSYDILRLEEIYNLNISADMLVLSACETGTGKLEEGEGISSLGKGIMEAGAKSVVQSLWSVDDKGTYELMRSFYAHLLKGKEKNRSLRDAQLQYLDNSSIPDRNKHPHFWSSFILSGETLSLGAPFVKSGLASLPSWSFGLLAALLLILVFGFVFSKRKKS